MKKINFTIEEIKEFAQNIKNWKNFDPKNKNDLDKVYEKDRKDLTDILNAIKEKDYSTAKTLSNNLDTIVRELIPTKIYNKLHQQ